MIFINKLRFSMSSCCDICYPSIPAKTFKSDTLVTNFLICAALFSFAFLAYVIYACSGGGHVENKTYTVHRIRKLSNTTAPNTTVSNATVSRGGASNTETSVLKVNNDNDSKSKQTLVITISIKDDSEKSLKGTSETIAQAKSVVPAVHVETM